MATIDLYIDTFAKRLVTSLTDTTPVRFPSLVQEDTPTLRIWLLQQVANSTIEDPYVFIPTAGVTLQLAIGTRLGSSSTLYTQQYTWTASGDTTNPYFEAQLPMNTAGITTLLGNQGTASAYLEVKMTDTYATTILSEQVTVLAAVIKSGGITSPIPTTALSAEVAAATFVKVEHTGSITLICETDSTKKIKLYCGTDGELHEDTIL